MVRLLPSIRPQMASLTPPLLIFQCALCGHHLEKGSGKKWWGVWVVFEERGREGWLRLARCTSAVNEFSCQYCMFEIFDTRSHLTSPTFMPSSLFTLPSISLPISPFYPLHPSLFFRVLRLESNLQQLSKSGMTDKLIFSSWVYIPGIWAADLAPNKRGVSASCLLKLMFSWPEMNYPVTRIYLYSS